MQRKALKRSQREKTDHQQRLKTDLSSITMEARVKMNNTQVLKVSNSQPRIICPEKVSLKIETEINTFLDKKNTESVYRKQVLA